MIILLKQRFGTFRGSLECLEKCCSQQDFRITQWDFGDLENEFERCIKFWYFSSLNSLDRNIYRVLYSGDKYNLKWRSWIFRVISIWDDKQYENLRRTQTHSVHKITNSLTTEFPKILYIHGLYNVYIWKKVKICRNSFLPLHDKQARLNWARQTSYSEKWL